jgi:hypothetical protein
MADWLVLKRDPDLKGPEGWRVVHMGRDKTADVAGATAALDEGIQGPGKYGVVRADNARTVNVTIGDPVTIQPDPNVVVDPSAEF